MIISPVLTAFQRIRYKTNRNESSFFTIQKQLAEAVRILTPLKLDLKGMQRYALEGG